MDRQKGVGSHRGLRPAEKAITYYGPIPADTANPITEGFGSAGTAIATAAEERGFFLY